MKIQHPYQKIPDACRTTGLSKFFLRKGCRNGEVPHIRSGRTYYVNVPALLENLAMQTDKGDRFANPNSEDRGE